MPVVRPEQRGGAQAFYGSEEASRYSNCHQTHQKQTEITEVALQLLDLPAGPQLLLDLGCGSGMSGNTIAAAGHAWIGCDISLDMLALASGIPANQMSSLTESLTSAEQPNKQSTAAQQQTAPPQQPSSTHSKSRTGFNVLNHRHTHQMLPSARGQGMVLWSDMAQGIPLRKASLDGVISISAVQWLCHRPNAEESLRHLFEDLYQCLKPHANAVLQVYIADDSEADMLVSNARKSGFSGACYVDFPHKGLANKYFLCLTKQPDNPQRHLDSYACPLAFPTQCPCTLQWLHATGQLLSQPSRTSSITNNHTKQAKRLLRLFRYALANSKPLPDTSADQPTSFLPMPTAAHAQPFKTESLTAQTEPRDTVAPSQGKSRVSSSLEEPRHATKVPQVSSHGPEVSQDLRQNPEATDAAQCAPVQRHALQGGHKPIQQHQTQHPAPVAQSQDGTNATMYLVETCIPWETLALSSCRAPCLIQFSLAAASWPHASAQQLNGQDSAAQASPPQDPVACTSAAQSSAAPGSAAGPWSSQQTLTQDSGTCFSAAQHSTAHTSLADQLSLRQAAQEHSQRGSAHSMPIGNAMPVDDTTLCLEAEHAVKQAVQQVLQGHAGAKELHFSSSVKRGMPISKTLVALQKGGRKRAKLSHEEHATLVPLQHDITTKASGFMSGNKTDSSRHSILGSSSAQFAGSSENYDPELNCQPKPEVLAAPLQDYVLQAKGVAPHVVRAVTLQQQQGLDCSRTALTALDKLLMSVVQKSLDAAQACAATATRVVAVDVHLTRHTSMCHIICYQ